MQGQRKVHLASSCETKDRAYDSLHARKAQLLTFQTYLDNDEPTRMVQVLLRIPSTLGNFDVGMSFRMVRSRCSVIRMCRAPADTASCSSSGVVTFVTPS
jgi:hypothetical protein